MSVQPESHSELIPMSLPENRPQTMSAHPLLAGLANAISQLLSPPLLAMVGLYAAANLPPAEQAPRLALVAFLWAVLLPTAYIIVQVKRGKMGDLHLNRREERFWPMILSVAGSVISWLFLFVNNAPTGLQVLISTQVLLAVITLIITRWWKISMHSSSIATLTIFLMLYIGPVMLPLLLLVPLVAWARIFLRRHTPLQTAAGASLGALLMWFCFLVAKTF